MVFGFGEIFSRNNQESINPQGSLPVQEKPVPQSNAEQEAIKEIEKTIRNLQLTIENNLRRIAQLRLDLASVQIEYGSDPLHPKVQGDTKFRSETQAEITSLEEDTELLQERLKDQVSKINELRRAA